MVKALITFEGVGHVLLPGFDVAEVSRRHIREIFLRQFSPWRVVQRGAAGRPGSRRRAAQGAAARHRRPAGAREDDAAPRRIRWPGSAERCSPASASWRAPSSWRSAVPGRSGPRCSPWPRCSPCDGRGAWHSQSPPRPRIPRPPTIRSTRNSAAAGARGAGADLRALLPLPVIGAERIPTGARHPRREPQRQRLPARRDRARRGALAARRVAAAGSSARCTRPSCRWSGGCAPSGSTTSGGAAAAWT